MRIVILCAAFICAAGFGHAIAGWPAEPRRSITSARRLSSTLTDTPLFKTSLHVLESKLRS